VEIRPTLKFLPDLVPSGHGRLTRRRYKAHWQLCSGSLSEAGFPLIVLRRGLLLFIFAPRHGSSHCFTYSQAQLRAPALGAFLSPFSLAAPDRFQLK
jgi:hypothetical protein